MNIPWVVIRSPTKHWSSEQGTCNILLKRPYNWSLEVFNWRMIPFKIWFKWRIQPSASLTTFLQLQNVMRGSETVSKYPFAHSSLQLHEISTYMPHVKSLHCKKILHYLSTIRWEKVSTIKKHNCQSATKWTYKGTTSNSRTTNKDWNAAMTARQNTQITTNQGAITSLPDKD